MPFLSETASRLDAFRRKTIRHRFDLQDMPHKDLVVIPLEPGMLRDVRVVTERNAPFFKCGGVIYPAYVPWVSGLETTTSEKEA